jgi:hypothetical protein
VGIKVSADVSRSIEFLDAIPAEVERAARPAAEDGARVLHDAVKRNIAGIGKKSGNLARAIYMVYSKDRSGPLSPEFHISWSARRAPHGHLVEFGHVQRYAAYIDKAGNWKTAIRPEKKGTPPPNRKKSSRAAMDAYYVPLPGGPRLVGARPFIRPAQALFPEVLLRMEQSLFEKLGAAGVTR